MMSAIIFGAINTITALRIRGLHLRKNLVGIYFSTQTNNKTKSDSIQVKRSCGNGLYCVSTLQLLFFAWPLYLTKHNLLDHNHHYNFTSNFNSKLVYNKLI